MSERIWLTWETQRRNGELAGAFECSFLELDYSKESLLVRILKSGLETTSSVLSRKVKTVFAQYPSLGLVSLVSFLRYFKKFLFVIDAHNIALEELNNPSSLRGKFSSWVFSRADYIIISNEALRPELNSYGDKALILPDKVPSIEEAKAPALFDNTRGAKLTLIASYASDEPIEEFIKGFQQIDSTIPVTLFITGKRSGAADLLKYESENIVFTDFLSEEEFSGLIQHSDLLADLTTREGCLVCGAYEALAVGVPVLLSNMEALRSTFPRGTIFADNSAESFKLAIESFFNSKERFQSEILEMKTEFNTSWGKFFNTVEEQISH